MPWSEVPTILDRNGDVAVLFIRSSVSLINFVYACSCVISSFAGLF